MPLRALLYRRPTEPKAIQVVHDKNIYLVRVRRHRQARRYTLRIQAATREVVLTMPPRGCLKEAKEFAQKHGGWIASRLHRLPEAELSALARVTGVSRDGGKVTLLTTSAPTTLRELLARDETVDDLTVSGASLEDAVTRLVQAGAPAQHRTIEVA